MADNFDTILQGLASQERQVSAGAGAGPKVPTAAPGAGTLPSGIAIPPPPSGPPREASAVPPNMAGAREAASVISAPAVGATAAQAIGAWAIPRVGMLANSIGRLYLPIQRVILGALGGAAAETATGGSPTTGAVIGGGGTAASELIGLGGRKVLQKAPVTRQMPGQAMARDVGTLAGQVSPPMAAGSAQELAALGTNPTQVRQAMGAYQEQALQKGEALLGGPVTVNIPAAGTTPQVSPIAAQAMANAGLQPGTVGTRMTPRQALDWLEELGAIGWPRKGEASPMLMGTQTMSAKAARDLWRQGHAQLETEIKSFPNGQAAWDAIERGRYARNAGLPLLEIAESDAWKKRTTSGVNVDTKAFQDVVRGQLDNLKARMRPDDYNTLKQIVWRGADPETADVTKNGLVARGMRKLGIEPAPGYTGVEPFTLPQWAQITFNALTTNMLDRRAASQPEPAAAALPAPRSLATTGRLPARPERDAAIADSLGKVKTLNAAMTEQQRALEAAAAAQRR